MKLSQDWRDVFASASLCEKPGRRILNRLQLPKQSVSDATESSVAVIQAV